MSDNDINTKTSNANSNFFVGDLSETDNQTTIDSTNYHPSTGVKDTVVTADGKVTSGKYFFVELKAPDLSQGGTFLAVSGDIADSQTTSPNNTFATWLKKNPALNVYLAMLAQKHIAQGKTPEDAQVLAQQEIVSTVQSKMDENEETDPSSEIQNAFASEIAEEFGLSPADAKATAQGVISGFGAFVNLTSALKTISSVNPPDPSTPSPAGPALQQALSDSQDMVQSALKLLATTNFSAADQITITKFMSLLSKMISDLQQLLINIQTIDAEQARAATQIQQQISQMRFEDTMKQLQEQLEQIREASKMAGIMKFLEPLIKYVLPIVAVLAMPFCGPAMLVAMIAVTAATTALTETGQLQNAMGQIANLVGKVCSAMGASSSVTDAIKALVLILVVALITAAAKGAAAGAGTAVANMVAVQIFATTLMSSEGVQDLVKSGYEAAGKDPNDPEVAKEMAIITAVVSALVMIVATAVCAKGAGGSSAIESENLAKAMRVIQVVAIGLTIAGDAIKATTAGLQAESENFQANMKEQAADLQKLIKILTSMINNLEQVVKSIQGGDKEITDFRGGLTKMFEDLTSSWSQIATQLSSSN